MPIDSEKCVTAYSLRNGKYEKVSEITQVEINTDDIDERELVKLRDRSALTVTVSLDDDTWRRLQMIVQRGIKRRRKYLAWKRNRRCIRRRR